MCSKLPGIYFGAFAVLGPVRPRTIKPFLPSVVLAMLAGTVLVSRHLNVGNSTMYITKELAKGQCSMPIHVETVHAYYNYE